MGLFRQRRRDVRVGSSDLSRPSPHPVREHVKEVVWAILLIDAIILLLGAALSAKTRPGAMWFFVGLAALVTALIGGLLLLNLAAVWLIQRWEAHRSRDRRDS